MNRPRGKARGIRFESAKALVAAVAAWAADRNALRHGINWRFTTADVRTKLRSLYPMHDDATPR